MPLSLDSQWVTGIIKFSHCTHKVKIVRQIKIIFRKFVAHPLISVGVDVVAFVTIISDYHLSGRCLKRYYNTAELCNKCQGLIYINFAFYFPIKIGSYLMIYDSLVFIKYQFGSVCIFISFSELQQQRIHIFVQAAQIF